MADNETLIAAARRAREHALAPFSQFKVGAALRDRRRPDHHRLQHRERDLRPDDLRRARRDVQGALGRPSPLHRASPSSPTPRQPTPPCGACRQILWEFGGDIEVILANLNAPRRAAHQLRDLLPLPFDARLLPVGAKCQGNIDHVPLPGPQRGNC